MMIRRRLLGAVWVAGMAAAMFAYDRTRNDFGSWWADHGGGVPYVVFWVAVLFVFLPTRRAAWPICLAVTLATCGLEALQLWDAAWLEDIRANRWGRALIGTSFGWGDIPPYFIGGVIGYIMFRLLLLVPVGDSRSRTPN